MTSEQFESQKQYEARMSIMRALLREGLITQSEYDKIDTKFLKKYKPIFGSYSQSEKKWLRTQEYQVKKTLCSILCQLK